MTIVGDQLNEDFWRTYLGISTPKIPICYTINISPNTVVKYKQDNLKCIEKWGALRPLQQRTFLCQYIRDHVYPKVDACQFTFELTKAGEVHAHGLCFIEDKMERSDYWISDLRKQVIQDNYIKKLNKNNPKRIITSNYIHKCDSIESWNGYMFKDIDKTPLLPYVCCPVARS